MISQGTLSIINDVKRRICGEVQLNVEVGDEDIKNEIERFVFEKSASTYIEACEKMTIVETVFNALRRNDIIEPLIQDKEITEIMINGPNDIFIEKKGIVSRFDGKFDDIGTLENIIRNIVSKVNRSANELDAIVDARLADGSRVNVVLQPIALNGPVMTIRKFPQKPLTMADIIKSGTVTKECSVFLEKIVRARYNVFISGSTNSGKTTMLNVLTNFIPADERIITIEDSAEIQVASIENLVRMETRNANSQGRGEVSMRDLIRASLRMRPDRIIIGEVRGSEALDMLQAMNTGHDGSISTGHANSTRDMLSRLETMILADSRLPLEAVRKQIASAIDIMIHLARLRDRSRRVLEVVEVAGFKNGEIILNPLFKFEECECNEESEGRLSSSVQGQLTRSGNRMNNTDKLRMAGFSDYEAN